MLACISSPLQNLVEKLIHLLSNCCLNSILHTLTYIISMEILSLYINIITTSNTQYEAIYTLLFIFLHMNWYFHNKLWHRNFRWHSCYCQFIFRWWRQFVYVESSICYLITFLTKTVWISISHHEEWRFSWSHLQHKSRTIILTLEALINDIQ